MARIEADRDDLYAEAIALIRRLEARTAAGSPEIVAGFRANGWLSVYFGPDPAYHFDDEGRLRRAYSAGLLYRTQGDTLAQLRRDRSATETTLWRTELCADDLAAFRAQMGKRLAEFADALSAGRFEIVRQLPVDDVSLVGDIVAGLHRVLTADRWLAPAIARRRGDRSR